MNMMQSISKYVVLTSLFFLMAMNVQAQDWEGSWKGTLKAGAQEIPLVFHIKKDAAGNLRGSMDSPSQMAYDLKADEVIVKDGEITLDFSVAHAQYVGKLNEDKSAINGNWVQGVPLELNLAKSEEAKPAFNRPQEPKGPFPYNIEEVQYENKKADNIKLAGTLTVPEGEGPFPAVVLISGSGPQDRDANILKHKSFWVLADYLTRNGVAVLRFDDRGVGASEGDFSTATSADFATDVEAGVAFLKTHAKIDVSKVGLMGHSEGGFIAPIVASKDKQLGFLVLLAGPGVPGNELLLQQNEDLLRENKTEERLIKALSTINSKLYTAIIKDKKNKLEIRDLMDMVKGDLKELSEKDRNEIGLGGSALYQNIARMKGPWMNYFINSKPSNNLKKVKCPVYALNGDKDLQVAGKQNLAGIEVALKKAKNSNFKCELLPGLNHLFQHSETGAPEEYINIEETFSAEAMEKILEWIKII